MVLPGGEEAGLEAETYISDLIRTYGDALETKPSKTSIGRFKLSGDLTHDYEHVSGEKGRDGIEYLGFRFDGKKVYLRNSTLSNFYRKITKRARKQARMHVARYEGKDADWLVDNFDFHRFEERFGRVRDFESVESKKGWTFWTYAKRASERFGERGSAILGQVKGYRSFIRRAVETEIEKQLAY